MTRAVRVLLVLLLMLAGTLAARRRDPLTEAESDQLREAALEPQKRLQLYIKFADARLTAVDQQRADPKLADGRGKRIHDLIEDFTAILDEINDNLDTYQGRPLDKDDRKAFRKGLKEVIEAGDRWELKLNALKTASETDPQTRREDVDFHFALQDALDALKSSTDLAREYMETKDKDQEPVKKK